MKMTTLTKRKIATLMKRNMGKNRRYVVFSQDCKGWSLILAAAP